MAVASAVEVSCLGLCPSSNCLLIDIDNGPRVLVDCPLEAAGLHRFPVDRAVGDVGGGDGAPPPVAQATAAGPGGDTGEGLFHTAHLDAVKARSRALLPRLRRGCRWETLSTRAASRQFCH